MNDLGQSSLPQQHQPDQQTGSLPCQPGEGPPQAFDRVQFDVDWRRTSVALRRYLIRFGCTPDQCDDVIQDTALRLLARRPSYAAGVELERYAAHVAKNLLISQWRQRQLETISLDETTAIVGFDDPELTVERRLAIEAIREGWKSLTGEEKSVLRGDRNRPTDRLEAVRRGVQLHRLRRRLRGLTAGLLGAAIAILTTSPGHCTTGPAKHMTTRTQRCRTLLAA